MDRSVFLEKNKEPSEYDLKKVLDDKYRLWKEIVSFTCSQNVKYTKEWRFSGAKYGWSFRIIKENRIIIYLLPRQSFFKVAFVFGQKAYEDIMLSNINEEVKNDLRTAKVYAEGRGIRINILNQEVLDDIRKLIHIKINSSLKKS